MSDEQDWRPIGDEAPKHTVVIREALDRLRDDLTAVGFDLHHIAIAYDGTADSESSEPISGQGVDWTPDHPACASGILLKGVQAAIQEGVNSGMLQVADLSDPRAVAEALGLNPDELPPEPPSRENPEQN